MNVPIYYANVSAFKYKLNPIRETEFYKKDQYVYDKCPAFNHKKDRTFIIKSPIDFSLNVERTPSGNFITCSHNELLIYNKNYLNSLNPVFQVSDICTLLFWTPKKDVWLLFQDHPMTSLNNNFIATSAWFNLSNWSRTSSLSFTVVDETKPVIIKEGDPMCRISFLSSNLDDGIILKEEKDCDHNFTEEYFKNRNREDSRNKLFSKSNSINKCPFSFLFK
jgi:hypothetical protein